MQGILFYSEDATCQHVQLHPCNVTEGKLLNRPFLLGKPVGYECDFVDEVDQVPEDYFCKQCSHVARDPVLLLLAVPKCSAKHVSTPSLSHVLAVRRPHKKYHKIKIHNSCSLKDHCCKINELQIQHLDASLDVTTRNCAYVNI